MSRTLLLSACEPSGDALGASLMAALRQHAPDTRFIGGGGPLMVEQGLEDPLDTDGLAVMGPADALAAIPKALGLASSLAALARDEKPDAAILVDSWAFSKAVADRIKKKAPETKLVKLGVPQVWASRPHRAAVAAELFDLLLCLLPFEPKHFTDIGGNAKFVGNPNYQVAASTPRSGPAFRARHEIGDAPLLLLLPGSRDGEVKRLLPVFEPTLQDIAARIPGLKTAVIAAPSVEERVRAATRTWNTDVLIVPPEERFNAFDAGDVALAASGTVTTELALAGTPMVVTYKVAPIAAYYAKKVITTPYVTILNIMAGDAVIPERIQQECMPSQLSADVVRLFQDDDARRRQTSAFRRLLPGLIGSHDAADQAAQEIITLVDGEGRGDLNGGASWEG
ncbi:MAG: lipid-A-disaccharide synthase [Pseudomonadota bacterium]